MDEDNLNLEIRKFLKQVGISSQREHTKKIFGRKYQNRWIYKSVYEFII